MKQGLFLLVFLFFLTNSSATENNRPSNKKHASTWDEVSRTTRGKVTFWRSNELGVIFGYDERWKPATPSQNSTVIVVNWTSGRSGGLMAACYLQTAISSIGNLNEAAIRERWQEIAESILKKGQLRDPHLKNVESRLATQDNYPVVYVVSDTFIKNINGDYGMRTYSLVTAWKGKELSFTCGSSVPVEMPELTEIVDEPILRLLSSLQFVR